MKINHKGVFILFEWGTLPSWFLGFTFIVVFLFIVFSEWYTRK